MFMLSFFFFNDTATTEIYTLSLHDALPISPLPPWWRGMARSAVGNPSWISESKHESNSADASVGDDSTNSHERAGFAGRSEEHTSELQSRQYLVCRLLLEKKKKILTQVTS